jgi:hypothetical protein
MTRPRVQASGKEVGACGWARNRRRATSRMLRRLPRRRSFNRIRNEPRQLRSRSRLWPRADGPAGLVAGHTDRAHSAARETGRRRAPGQPVHRFQARARGAVGGRHERRLRRPDDRGRPGVRGGRRGHLRLELPARPAPPLVRVRFLLPARPVRRQVARLRHREPFGSAARGHGVRPVYPLRTRPAVQQAAGPVDQGRLVRLRPGGRRADRRGYRPGRLAPPGTGVRTVRAGPAGAPHERVRRPDRRPGPARRPRRSGARARVRVGGPGVRRPRTADRRIADRGAHRGDRAAARQAGRPASEVRARPVSPPIRPASPGSVRRTWRAWPRRRR